MVAPKGNQFAAGNSGPPPSRFTKEFIEKEAKAFTEWFKIPQTHPCLLYTSDAADE